MAIEALRPVWERIVVLPSTISCTTPRLIVSGTPQISPTLGVLSGMEKDTPRCISETMKVLVFGSRDWVDQIPIHNRLKQLPPGTIIVHGGCRGADNIAGFVAELLRFEVRAYPVSDLEWHITGPSAGNVRNQRMLNKEHPATDGTYIDLALCFHIDEKLGRGSRDMMSRVKKAIPAIPHEKVLRLKKNIDLCL